MKKLRTSELEELALVLKNFLEYEEFDVPISSILAKMKLSIASNSGFVLVDDKDKPNCFIWAVFGVTAITDTKALNVIAEHSLYEEGSEEESAYLNDLVSSLSLIAETRDCELIKMTESKEWKIKRVSELGAKEESRVFHIKV